VEGEEPPFDDAAEEDFVDAGLAAGAALDAELEFDAGAAAGAAAGADDFDDEALELAGAADESDDAAVDFFERDFLVVEASELFDADDVSDFASVFESDFEAVDASVDESAAAFFERDFFVVPVEASVLDADFESDLESADASVESAAFFECDFLVEESVELVSPPVVVVDDFFLEEDLVDVPLALESSVELPSAEAAFFFFLLLEVVLLSVLESLDALLLEDVDCAFADFAAMDADPKTRAAHASAVNTFCHIVFMIVPPVCSDLNYEFCLLARPAAYALAFSNRPWAAGDSRAATQLSKWPLSAEGRLALKWFTTTSTISCALSCGRPVFCIITWTSSFMPSSPLEMKQFEVIPGPNRKNAVKNYAPAAAPTRAAHAEGRGSTAQSGVRRLEIGWIVLLGGEGIQRGNSRNGTVKKAELVLLLGIDIVRFTCG
jgi:hypothetical protein